ncbi:MAG: hypothetical protein HQ562_04700 [Candidatus Marinimicrobia bacterium]|nr:hypothetical protein [Candidatus Neomarinimicrobiota bacterium]
MDKTEYHVIFLHDDEINPDWDQLQPNLDKNIFRLFINNQSFIIIKESFYKKIEPIDSFFTKKILDKYHDYTINKIWNIILGRYVGIMCRDYTFQSTEEFRDITNDPSRPWLLFVNCDFKNCNTIRYYSDGNRYWVKCKNINISFDLDNVESKSQVNLTRNFVECEFNTFEYLVVENDLLFLNKNDFKIIRTNSQNMRFSNVKFCLLHHTDLSDNCNFSFDNVTIEYNSQLIRKISTNFYTGYLNTFTLLSKNEGLFSEKYTIGKYINYFSTGKSRIKKLLYHFNHGYNRILVPLIITMGIILIKWLILVNNQTLLGNTHPFTPVVNPYEMYKSVIFSNINIFSDSMIWWKILLFVLEPLYIYSFFSMITGIKRFLGFKIES